jgi:hypothetical protein
VTPTGDTAEIYVEWQNVARQKSEGIRLPVSLLVGAAP